MAGTNYGRERSTPKHVRGHDNPVPLPNATGVGPAGLVRAALGPLTGGGSASPTGPGGLGGLKPLPGGISVPGAFGKPRPKGPKRGKKLTA